MNTQRRAIDPTHRPHPVDAADVRRTHAAFDRLLCRPSDWLLELHHNSQQVEFFRAPLHSALSVADRAILHRAGFRRMTLTRHEVPGAFGEIVCESEIWIDPTTTIRAEVKHRVDYGVPTEQEGEVLDAVSCSNGAVFFVTYFADGTAIVMYPDNMVTDELATPGRVTLSGTENPAQDYPRFLVERQKLIDEGRVPLMCPDVATYVLHEELHGRYMHKRGVIADLLKLDLAMHFGGPLTIFALAITVWLVGWTGTTFLGVATWMLLYGGYEVWKRHRPRERYPQESIAECLDNSVGADFAPAL